MPTRYESEVMSAVCSLCDGTDGCLISPSDILSVLPERRRHSHKRIDDAISALKADGYLDVIYSERLGERMYLISLKESGLAYTRSSRQKRSDLMYKVFLALVGATVTFVFGLILKAIF